MKAITKVGIIIASVMLVIGIIICGVTLVLCDFDFRNFDTNVTRQSKSFTATEPVTALQIVSFYDDVKIIPSSYGECRVDYYDSDRVTVEISLADGQLNIKQTDNRKWYEFINISFGYSKGGITVYLPEGTYEYLNVKSPAGDVELQAVTAKNAVIETASGDIEISGLTGTAADISTASGDIDITGAQLDDIYAKSVSGDIEVNSLKAAHTELKSTSGGCELEGLETEGFIIKTTSGDISAENLKVQNMADFKTTSGNIELDGCDAGEFNFESVSGDIYCRLLSPKYFDINTTSGDIRTPTSDISGGKFTAKTTSGNVTVKYE